MSTPIDPGLGRFRHRYERYAPTSGAIRSARVTLAHAVRHNGSVLAHGSACANAAIRIGEDQSRAP